MDALSEILRVIRLSGSAFIDAEVSAPWAIETPTAVEISRRLAPNAGRIIPYHLVSEGTCIAQLEAETPIIVSANEVICFPHGDVHVLSSAPNLEPLRITTEAIVTLTRPDSISRTRYGGKGLTTKLICGFFACDRTLSDHLVSLLPRVLKFRVGADSAATLLPVSARGSYVPPNHPPQPGAQAVLCKLSELLFVDAVRSYVETLPDFGGGWLAGLKDRHVSHALALIHGEPGMEWTLDSLSARIGTSRTTLADRFARTIGQAPMQYLSQWRLRLAASALDSSDRAIKKIADDAGFGSTAAFSRAFKREFGVSPARWRRSSLTGISETPP